MAVIDSNNPAQAGSNAVLPDATLDNFAYFVNTYIAKKRRDGTAWTLAQILADEELSTETLTMFWNWCQGFQPAGSSPDAIIAGSQIVVSPMNTFMSYIPGPPTALDIVALLKQPMAESTLGDMVKAIKLG